MTKKSVKKKVVCLGGGIGTVNLIHGLKDYDLDLTVVVSMADDGGSSGRLRRLYGIFPPGDVVSCMASLAPNDSMLSQILKYRFAGDRYGRDNELGGHKLGNLILTAFNDFEGNFAKAIKKMQEFFNIPHTILPATDESVTISAKTIQDRYIHGEEKIDLGKYQGKRILESVSVHPEHAKANKEAVYAILNADVVILGPGDLYTAQLPVVVVDEIAKSLKESKAKKIYVVNIANKPFETRGYKVIDYIDAVKRHLGNFYFDSIVINNNFKSEIPKKYKYHYVRMKDENKIKSINYILEDLVDDNFPLYHDSKKLAKIIHKHI
ncbi:MAG TPA: gluconeogenesis factor YvcK family protein [Patescibacteria group bacterium]